MIGKVVSMPGRPKSTSEIKDKVLLFPRRDIVEATLYVKKNGAQYMVQKKCGVGERIKGTGTLSFTHRIYILISP